MFNQESNSFNINAAQMFVGCSIDVRWMFDGCSFDLRQLLVGISIDARWIFDQFPLTSHWLQLKFHIRLILVCNFGFLVLRETANSLWVFVHRFIPTQQTFARCSVYIPYVRFSEIRLNLVSLHPHYIRDYSFDVR